MFDKKLLQLRMLMEDTSQARVARSIGLSAKTFSLKMNGKIDWKLEEVQKLCKLLHIDNPCEIFFPD